MTARLDLVVPGGFGGGWQARAGEYVTVIDLEGEQTGDFVAFVADDPEEWLSPVHCREALRSIFVHEGDRLVSNRRRAILEIVHDDVGVHDATIPACDPTRYAVEFGVPGHREPVGQRARARRRDRPHARAAEPVPEHAGRR